ncbi:MAG: thioredoxin [Oscillospiraceae bacterium]|nr:thioredoxin [Oscillospiraceae bacterium]MDD7353565.1 thioredoxin [Oscillospiraceae bacterium]MDY3938091.1 thioredoxin [Oscillospiraceae bacterium]
MEIKLTKDNFDAEVINSNIPVLVDFWATWCGPCRMIAPVIESIAEKFDGRIKVGKVNVDEEPEISLEYNIASIPTVMIFKNGEEVSKSIGYSDEAEIEQLVLQAIQ